MKIGSIKFSTVNPTKGDPYSLGLTLIEDGSIKDTIHYSFNVGDAEIYSFMTFIPETRLREGLSFSDQWMDIREIVNSCDYLCCFRSGDDFNVLYQALSKRGLPLPKTALFDVQGIVRRLFIDMADYMYKSVALKLGIDGGDDLLHGCNSKIVAEMVLNIIKHPDVVSLENAFQKFQITPGSMGDKGYTKIFMTR